MRKTSFTILTIIIIAASFASGWGCSGESGAKAKLPETKEQAAKPKTDSVEKKKSEELSEISTSWLSGSAEAHRRSVLSVKVPGNVEKVHVKEGQYVNEGELLVTLDSSDIALQLQQGEAALDAAKANYEISKLDYDRMKSLLESNSISKAQFDVSEARLKAAEAGVKQAAVAVEMGKKAMKDTMIKAPYKALVIKKMISEGERATTMPPTPLIVIEDVDIIDLRIQVPESETANVKEGDEVLIAFKAINKEFKGKISRIVASLVPQMRAFSAIIEIPNKDRELRPGMFAEVKLLNKENKQSANEPVKK